MFPAPIKARVYPVTSVPMYLVLDQFPAGVDLLELSICLATERVIAMVLLSRRNRITKRDIHHNNPFSRRCPHTNIFNSDTRPTYHFKFLTLYRKGLP